MFGCLMDGYAENKVCEVCQDNLEKVDQSHGLIRYVCYSFLYNVCTVPRFASRVNLMRCHAT
jgi:hypothetical protein